MNIQVTSYTWVSFLVLGSTYKDLAEIMGNPELMWLTWDFLGREAGFQKEHLYITFLPHRPWRRRSFTLSFCFLRWNKGQVFMTVCTIVWYMWENCGVHDCRAHTISFCVTSKKYLVHSNLFSQMCELAMAGPDTNVSSLAVKITFFSECRWFKKSTLRPSSVTYIFDGLLKAWYWISPPCRLKIFFNDQENFSSLWQTMSRHEALQSLSLWAGSEVSSALIWGETGTLLCHL